MSPYINPDTAPGYLHAGLKVGWAKHHLRRMAKEIDVYLGRESKPYSVTAEDDLEAEEYVIRFDLEPASVELALMAGDFLACLRGSLDHMTTALTQCTGGTYNSRASFPTIEVNNSKGRQSFNSATQGVPNDAVCVIESLQPYHAGHAYKSTKLWRLNKLWNVDKHRRIPLHPSFINMKLTYSAEIPPISTGADNSGVVRFPLSAKPYIELNPAIEIGINFGDVNEGIIMPFSEMIDLHHFVRDDVMPRFKGFF